MISKNIFVLFPPGTGGNHIANMLATDKFFAARATVDDYQNHAPNNAHVSGINNLNIKTLPNQNCHILCGHWGEYFWLWNQKLLDNYPNRQIVLVTLPVPESLAYHRYQKFAPISDYYIEEQRSLYTPLVIEKIFKEHDWFEFDPNWVFSSSLDNFFEFVRLEMNLKINHDICNIMHGIWLEKIKKII